MFPDLTRDDVFRIETRHLWLRWPRAIDTKDFVRLANDETVSRMTNCLPHPLSDEAAHAAIVAARTANLDGRGHVLAVSPVNDPTAMIGMVGLVADETQADGLVLGYWLGRPYWGQGLMSEAVSAVIDMAFVLTPAAVVRTPVRADNAAARKVLGRCGFPADKLAASADGFATATISRGDWLAARRSVPERIQLPQAAA